MPESQLRKLDPRAKPYILIGYGPNQYKLADIVSKRTIWARDVYILEGKFANSLEISEQLASDDDQLVIEDEEGDQLAERYQFQSIPIPIESTSTTNREQVEETTDQQSD
jgi:hypothetical protein